MRPNQERRLSALESRVHSHPPARVCWAVIDPDRTVVGIHANGETFDRLPGESEHDLRQRALTAVGWEGEL